MNVLHGRFDLRVTSQFGRNRDRLTQIIHQVTDEAVAQRVQGAFLNAPSDPGLPEPTRPTGRCRWIKESI